MHLLLLTQTCKTFVSRFANPDKAVDCLSVACLKLVKIPNFTVGKKEGPKWQKLAFFFFLKGNEKTGIVFEVQLSLFDSFLLFTPL